MSVSDLTKVPSGYRDPATVDPTQEGQQGKGVTRASQVMMGLKPVAFQAYPSVGGHDYLGGEPVPSVAFNDPQATAADSASGASADGAGAMKGAAGGMKMKNAGDAKARAFKILQEELGKKNVEGIAKGDIPSSVAQALLSGRMTPRQALERIRKAEKEKASEKAEATDATANASDATTTDAATTSTDTAE